MNIGIVASSIIGGMVLLAIVTLNIRVHQHSTESTLYNITKMQTDLISELVSYDIRRAGYRVGGNAVNEASENLFSFNTTNVQTGESELITWMYDTTQTVSGTINPDDHPLIRAVNADTISVGTGVTSFRFTFYDSEGDETADLSEIRQIKVAVICQSPYPFGERYARAAWEGWFTPRNLNH